MSELERELRELRVEWPATPDLAGAMAGRLAAGPAPRRSWVAWPGWRIAVALGAVLVAVVMAVPPARSAILDLLGFGSVRIERTEPRPSPGADLGLGDPVTLARARRSFGVLVPAALGPPDEVYLTTVPVTRVDLVYGPRSGRPRLLVTEFRAVASPVIEKAVGGASTVERLTVGGDPAFFISGADHGFAYVPEEGDVDFEEQRLAGPTLLVERSDGVLLRLEGDLSREEAVRIALSAG